MRKCLRALSLALCLVMALSLAPAARAAGVDPAPSTNIDAQDYVNGGRWTDTVKSYLYENSMGGLTRVEYISSYTGGAKVVVEDYDSQFRLQASRTVPTELSIWGGFFAGEDYNFLVFGQDNEEENDGKEVIRVVKYSKDWQRLGAVGLYGGNTIHPFQAGSLRCAEYDGYLYVRTCHEMYASAKDGKNHQASMILLVRQDDMKITDSAYEVGGPGYVSHSFNQFILIDQDRQIVTLDHGDAYPRSIVLQRFIAKAGQDSLREEKRIPAEQPGWYYTVYEDEQEVQAFPGQTGANDTGCSLGGFAETANGYAAAYAYDGVGRMYDPRNIYFAFIGKDLSVKTTPLTSNVNASAPQVVPTGLDGGYVLWNQDEVRYTSMGGSYTVLGDTLYYARYDANGNVGPVQTASAHLSDCAPIYWNGKVVWYVTNKNVPVFYALDASGLSVHVASADAGSTTPDQPQGAMALARTQDVLLDGRAVQFKTYALRDANGGVTNYIKLRDMAYHLNGTRAQFSVDWSRETGITLTSGAAYTPDGTELSTPFTGDRAYQERTDATVVDGVPQTIPAITLTDDSGGAYTYYKLRDLGRYLDFNVSYINGQIVVNTNEAYSDAQ